jgi:hypothetical protein
MRFLPFLLGRRNPGVQLLRAWNGRAAICTHTPLSGNVTLSCRYAASRHGILVRKSNKSIHGKFALQKPQGLI